MTHKFSGMAMFNEAERAYRQAYGIGAPVETDMQHRAAMSAALRTYVRMYEQRQAEQRKAKS